MSPSQSPRTENDSVFFREDVFLQDFLNETSDPELINETSRNNKTMDRDLNLPEFTTWTLTKIVIICILFVIAAIGNLFMARATLRLRRRSGIYLLLLHLSVGELLVTCITMPSEAIWAYTVSWWAGDTMCRILMFTTQMLGLYLSTYITVCISLDRCVAIAFPLKKGQAPERARSMVIVSWALSLIFCIPQAVIFHVEVHQYVPSFHQCVTYNFYSAEWQEDLYNMLVFVVMYPAPMVIMVACYVCIFVSLFRHWRGTNNLETGNKTGQRERLFSKAKVRTLQMAAGILTTFFVCWTPFYCVMMWHLFFQHEYPINQIIFDVLYLFGVSNACVNPVVYGKSVVTRKPGKSFLVNWYQACLEPEEYARKLDSTKAAACTRLSSLRRSEQRDRMNSLTPTVYVEVSRRNSSRIVTQDQLSGSRV
ncbi:gonadotropin-releasing hormone receptor-like [Branchiostoma floridae]|uniref:Gonadotropin-releasing hormone receptor-like n=1 Tax=Branchiostoma floridae TaxID=7739 RepID=A0A9J7KPB9_BRAFL|nr:gonadotropin-releasing hormone receptor-like [Branchiostoma floridae]